MELTFSGSGGEDVTVFLHLIQKNALAQGHQRDDGRIADNAAASLTGAALRWYSDELEEDVQYSWKKLRSAMLHRFHDPDQTPNPQAPLPDAQHKVIHGAPHLITMTANNFATSTWAGTTSRGLRIYKPGRDGIQEFCEGDTKNGLITWNLGQLLKSDVSETAPIAATSSFGHKDNPEKMMVFFVSRDNHLRAHQYYAKWKIADIDVTLDGVCTGIAATWHKDDGGQSVWSVCYSTDHAIHLRQDTTNPSNDDKICNVHRSFPKTPNAFVSAAAALNNRVTSFRTGLSTSLYGLFHIPAFLGRRHIAGVNLEEFNRGIQIFVMENGNIGLYELKERDGEFEGPSYLLPEGYVSSESAISVTVSRTPRLKIYVFFTYSGNNVGYCMYDKGSTISPAGWKHGIYTVQT